MQLRWWSSLGADSDSASEVRHRRLLVVRRWSYFRGYQWHADICSFMSNSHLGPNSRVEVFEYVSRAK